MSDSNMAKELLAQHPKAIGYLFAIGLVLTQVGTAAATGGTFPGT